ncbi:MAG: glucosidase [Dehalococcoidia bacterium]|nr:glucosidase [Dehalococcoidia bacterium]MCB9486964.1 glucosidase [Thermoflexaceae bacterium]
MSAEQRRLREANDGVPWRQWGPYVAARQWGTVREDYSEGGTAWEYFPHDHARSRAYRWGEDGIFGVSDHHGLLNFALSMWNGTDPILKERFFGLTGNQGNHGEDVKECYYFLDNTPTHSYMRALYKYPHLAFPYQQLIDENGHRGRDQPEYELVDTGIFNEGRYFDVSVEYAKAGPHDLVIRISAINRGPESATLHLLPTLWYRNTWAWGYSPVRPSCTEHSPNPGFRTIRASHDELGDYWLACEGVPELLFTGNDTNFERLWGVPNSNSFVKDGIGRSVVDGSTDAVNPRHEGTKVAAHYVLDLAAGSTGSVLLRLSNRPIDFPFTDAAQVLEARQLDAEEFYRGFGASELSADERLIQRQSFAGLLWNKQLYHWDVDVWLNGDPAGPVPPQARLQGRNHTWRHLNAMDILSMPDTWEFPWFAAWDLAFHCIPLALIDPEFAKGQLILLLREWYMHPNGHLPAYEWALGDVNPPVHAWAALRVFRIEGRLTGNLDYDFLERVFHKLLLNFTWWVNRKDSEGNNVFGGGFLGLDNIGVFDRSNEAPEEGHLEQADGTAWMGMFSLNMLAIALELASRNPVYEDVATKFFEHFLYIAAALNNIGGHGIQLWDEEDQFFYDVVHEPSGASMPLKVRSLVGLIPLLAVETIEPDILDRLPGFRRRLEWFLANRPDLADLVASMDSPGQGERRLLALVQGERLRPLLSRMLDREEFLSDFGIRSLSRYHAGRPFELSMGGVQRRVDYEPGESRTGAFGGNSNWRGPVWFPINHLIVEALQKFHWYYGDEFTVECPTGSGDVMDLWRVSRDLSQRLTSIFRAGPDGRRPVNAGNREYAEDPAWKDLVLFHEYFHGETGAGLGANHQTGWTALIAKLLEQSARYPTAPSHRDLR